MDSEKETDKAHVEPQPESQPGTPPTIDRLDIPDSLFGGLGRVPKVREVIEELATAWRGELVSERDYKWRVGKALINLKSVLQHYKQDDTFFPSIRVMLNLSSQQARHRMRVVSYEHIIRRKAQEAKKEFDRLSWAEMLELIRTPNSGKMRGTKESQTGGSKKADDGTKVVEISRTGDRNSLTADTPTPPNFERTFPVARERVIRFRAEVVKQKMAERKIKGSVENVLALVRDLASVEVLLDNP